MLRGVSQVTLFGLNISPSSVTITYSDTQQFTSAGGVAPFTFTKTSGSGSITLGGLYTPAASGAAPGVPLSAVIRVTDNLGAYKETTIYTTSDLAITPTAAQEIYYSDTVDFDGLFGVGAYSFSRLGVGTVNSSTGVYTAPASGGTQTATVTVTDTETFTATSGTITTYPTFSVSPAGPLIVETGTTQAFTSTGGKPSTVWSKQSGVGSIDASGVYTAPSTNGSAVIRGADALTANQDVSIDVRYDVLSLLGDGVNDYADFAYSSALDFNWNSTWSLSGRIKIKVDPIVVVAGQNKIDFVTDSGTYVATVPAGSYATINLFRLAVKNAFLAADPVHTTDVIYGVPSQYKFKITSSGAVFSIKWNTGANAPQNIANQLGFNVFSDSTGSPPATGYSGGTDVYSNTPAGTIASSVDGNNLVGGFLVSFEEETHADRTYSLKTYIVENFNLGRALAIKCTTVVSSNTWVDFVVTYDGSGTAAGFNTYLNQVNEPISTMISSLTGAASTTSHPVWIGAAESLNNYVCGNLDELGFWNVKLNQTDVDATVSGGYPENLNNHPKATNLIAYIRPEGESGGVVPDASGNGRSVTLRNGMTTSSDV